MRGAGSGFRFLRFVDEEDGSFDKWEHLTSTDSIARRWVPPRLRFYEPGETGLPGDSKRRPASAATDMPYVYGHGLLVVSSRLAGQCNDLLLAHGELLPVDVTQGGEFFAYHCTRLIDCLDVERSRLSRSRVDGRILNFDTPVFHADRLSPWTIFRLSVGNTEVLYCDDEAHAALTAPPLQGVTADVVWRSP